MVSHKWVTEGPISSWDEALPLGNGLFGLLLWKGDGTIQVSLDRSDLWDNRVPKPFTRKDWNWDNLHRLILAKKWKEISRRFGEIFVSYPYPTKLPAGRLHIDLPENRRVSRFTLDRSAAIGKVDWKGGTLEALCEAGGDIVSLRFKGDGVSWRLSAPPYGRPEGQQGSGMSGAELVELGYPEATQWKEADGCGFTQATVSDGAFSVVVLSRSVREWIELYLTIQPAMDAATARQSAMNAVESARQRGWHKISGNHRKKWRDQWQNSSVFIPDPRLNSLYQQSLYFLGSISRPDGPPISLQGVWTADDGRLPPWRGDYHHNINTQMSYWPHLTAGHSDRFRGFLDHMWSLVERHRALASSFFGVDGIFVPGAMGLDGQLIGGYAQVSYSPTNGAWVAQMFYQYWKYTGNQEYLREQGFPYCAGVGEFLIGMLKKGAKGKLKLPVSASPEIHEGGPEGWVEPNSHYDLSLMRWLFGALIEMSDLLEEDSSKWKAVLDRLDALPVSDTTEDECPQRRPGAFLIAPDKALDRSHRHHSHLMAIYPLGLATKDNKYGSVIEQSLRQIDRLGTGLWIGFSFPWIACIAARAGHPERAAQAIRHFAESFVSPNGFHLNGDFQKRGISWWNYRPFTIEGNFGYMGAIHEMLLQTWGGIVRFFPAVPDEWQEASFSRLRGEGGTILSACRSEGRTKNVEIHASCDIEFQIADPFEGDGTWDRAITRREEGFLTVKLGAGESLHGTI